MRIRPSQLRIGAAAGAASLLLSLTACGEDDLVGVDGPDNADPPLGAVERTESIDALNLVLVTEGEGVARLVGTVINEAEETDRLIGIDVDTEIGPYSLIFAEGPLLLPTGEPLRLAREAEVTVVSDRLRPGFMAEVTLLFENSEPVVSQVLVKLREGAYSEVEVMRPPDGDISPDS